MSYRRNYGGEDDPVMIDMVPIGPHATLRRDMAEVLHLVSHAPAPAAKPARRKPKRSTPETLCDSDRGHRAMRRSTAT